MAGIGENKRKCEHVFVKGAKKGQRCETGVICYDRNQQPLTYCSRHAMQHVDRHLLWGKISEVAKRFEHRLKEKRIVGRAMAGHQDWANDDDSDSDEE
jgi:hypothetical protein